MAPCGAISVSSSIGVMTLLDDHDLLGVAMAPASVPAAVPVFAELGASTGMMIAVMIAAAFDHDGLSTCYRRRCNDDRAEGRKNVSKLLHVRSSDSVRTKHRISENVPGELQESSERLFSLIGACNM